MDPADGCDFFWVGKHKSYSGEFSKLCSIKSIMEFSVEGKKTTTLECLLKLCKYCF